MTLPVLFKDFTTTPCLLVVTLCWRCMAMSYHDDHSTPAQFPEHQECWYADIAQTVQQKGEIGQRQSQSTILGSAWNDQMLPRLGTVGPDPRRSTPKPYPTPSQLGIPRSGSVSAHCIPDAKPPLPHGNLDPRHSGEPTTERRYQLMAQNLAVPATWHIDPCDQQVGLPVGMSSWI